MRKFELILRKTRNIGQKRKNRVVNHNKKGRTAAAFGGMLISGILILSGMEMQVSAQTIRHTHSGDTQNGGECFANPVYHTHDGDDTTGGECYSSPVYHVHSGDSSQGGACYGQKITHTHSGNAFTGGACYATLYHQHNDSCYAQGPHESSCPSHREYHSYDCGTIHDWDGDGHGCDGFISYDCAGHVYQACGMSGGTIIGYAFSCNYGEGQVIGYQMDCGKSSETIEAYELTCTKTSEDIDRYENTCGMEEGQEIEIPDPPSDNNSGNESGGESGGGFPDEGGTESGNMEPESAEDTVDSGEFKKTDSSGSDDGGDDGSGSLVQEPVQASEPVAELTTEPSASVEPTIAEVTTQAPIRKKQKIAVTEPSPTYYSAPAQSSPSHTNQVFPKTVEEEKIEISKAAAQPEDEGGEPLVLKRKWAIFTPVIRVISITTGTLLLLAGIAVLLLYLRKSVRIYNDNGKGRMKYLGRAAVKLSEEGYYIQITDKLMERATTNRYCIRPDLFLIGKNSSWEICIVRDGKKKSVYLDKEMTFTI